MKLSRRKFLTAGSLAALAMSVDRLASAGLVVPESIGAQPLVRSRFTRHLNDVFHVQRDVLTRRDLRLIEIADIVTGVAHPTPEMLERCFSLRFHGPAEQRIEQGTYQFEHPALGGFPMFIVPVGRPAAVQTYEAIFNSPPGAAPHV